MFKIGSESMNDLYIFGETEDSVGKEGETIKGFGGKRVQRASCIPAGCVHVPCVRAR